MNTPLGNYSLSCGTAAVVNGTFNIRTNTSAQIRAVSNIASTTLNLATYGWIDTRGRLN